MRKDVFLYISGPITASDIHSVEDNVAEALHYYLRCVRNGWPAFCPQLTAAFPSAFNIDYETWIACDLAIIDRCTHILMLPRWRESRGSVRERNYAESKGISIFENIEDIVYELPVAVKL